MNKAKYFKFIFGLVYSMLIVAIIIVFFWAWTDRAKSKKVTKKHNDSIVTPVASKDSNSQNDKDAKAAEQIRNLQIQVTSLEGDISSLNKKLLDYYRAEDLAASNSDLDSYTSIEEKIKSINDEINKKRLDIVNFNSEISDMQHTLGTPILP